MSDTITLRIRNLSADVNEEIQVTPNTSVMNLKATALAVMQPAVQLSDTVTKLIHQSNELSDSASVAESNLMDYDELLLVCIEAPKYLCMTGNLHWNAENSPCLQNGELFAMITSVGLDEGTEDGVTRQCVKCARSYKIHFCRQPDMTSITQTINVNAEHIAVLHRKTGGRNSIRSGASIEPEIVHGEANGVLSTLIVFTGGYPSGGGCFADVHAPWGNCFSDIPRGGSTIIEVPWE
eukprot:TRINITY_DN67741_c0_g1_i1.p1 TRINITY_DN67741_c0_g1~~TRINITY_DN67741_c0_g1_i1.p1  ORF type:complete len:253 (-),score=3.50 TRINITY_DN67741_c0_g1_i1:97-807(-)